MKPFAAKLFAPRPSFHLDITPEELSVMQTHGEYWRNLLEKKIAVAFGPVLDPESSWGIALFYAEDDLAAQRIINEDPAKKAGLRFEVYPMGGLVH
ncbi:MAG TPA: YciI family protein [Candidatus Baltobacteraceae bacterium]|nr:YciI family protein [Candidatus Baltobacteraceae bacterium]